MLICEEEDSFLVLHSQLVVQDLQIITEAALTIASTQSDFKHITTSGIWGQFTQTLFTTTAHTNQQGVALVHPDHTMNAGQVFQRIVKQDQIHWSVTLIVILQNLLVKSIEYI